MTGKSYISETQKTLNIVKSGKLSLHGKTIDIADKLDRTEKKSVEYRAKDITSLSLSGCIIHDWCEISVKAYKSAEALHVHGGERTAVLNFASSKNPGGGFVRGMMAQEESLCYASNLYGDLLKHRSFYEYNNNHLMAGEYMDGVIYSGDICFFRDASFNNIEPYFMDVITCAAPNRGAMYRKMGKDEANRTANEAIRRRVEQVLKVAAVNNVEHLVLGAFGCGVFKNDPDTVAKEMHRALFDLGYVKYFKRITFAMGSGVGKNTEAFVKMFKKHMTKQR